MSDKQKKKKKQKKQKGYNYFDAFVNLTEYSCAASGILDGVLKDFDAEKLPGQIETIHDIEHQADTEKHSIMKALAREFITPLEREDIAEMTQLLDDVTDSIEDILIKIYIYDIKTMKPEALQFSAIIQQCCSALKETMKQFCNFKKNALVLDHIIEVNRLEGEGDVIYNKAMRDLHAGSKDPVEIMTWSRLFDRFEMCCDAFEDVADTAEYVIMKNS